MDVNNDLPSHDTSSCAADSSISTYLVGDLLWSRIPGYPYWPCMVSYDPMLSIYSKRKSSHKSMHVVYHVQYFGNNAHRGWTLPRNTIVFEGREKFEALVMSVKEGAKSLNSQARQKLITKYSVAPAQREKWEAAVMEAEEAFTMSRIERIETLTFKYETPKKVLNNGRINQKKSVQKREMASAVNGNDEMNPPPSEKEDSGYRLEKFCQICELPDADISCTGLCMKSFHSDCLGLLSPSHQFVCDECISGKHTCFHCKNNEGEMRKCSSHSCGKFYHQECLESYPMADKEKFICPLHFCISCYNDNPKNPCVYKSRLIKCLRCPTAYHLRNGCIAAGCQQLSQYTILCPEHFMPSKRNPYHTVCNISWCFICGEGGKLLLCDSCPAAFHIACLDVDPPEGRYFCEECLSRKNFRYGNIVWVKLGAFRWWPAAVKNPDEIPRNILALKHSVGQFPIQFFGTYDYYWVHKGRTFLYSEEDKFNSRVKNPKCSSMDAKFMKGLHEAALAFDKWAEAKLKDDAVNEKPPLYKHIKTNKPVGKVQVLTGNVGSYVKCLCNPAEKQCCGYNSNCINRSMLVECHASICPAGDACQNQVFQKRQNARVAPFRTLTRGWALKALEEIKSGQFIIEYVGDLIDQEEFKRRLEEKHENDDNNFYFLTLDKDRIIDAGPKGNFSRFMNHSCEPNCETQKWIVNGDFRIGLFAKCDISAGNELTFDYMLDSLDNEKLKCLCGAPTCRGAIGEKRALFPKTTPKVKQVTKRKKKQKQTSFVKRENMCYKCKEPGNLITCDQKACPKAYHILCLSRSDVPSGQWQCPWHFCDICGLKSKYKCSQCPNSFCKKHIPGDFVASTNAFYICSDHDSN